MANPVYSRRLLAHVGAGAGDYFSTSCPPGFTWVIRDLDVYGRMSVLERVKLLLRGADGGSFVHMAWDPDEDKSQQWQGRQVVFEGEQFSVEVSGTGNVDFTISGYQLTN